MLKELLFQVTLERKSIYLAHCKNIKKHVAAVTPAYGDGLWDLCFGGA